MITINIQPFIDFISNISTNLQSSSFLINLFNVCAIIFGIPLIIKTWWYFVVFVRFYIASVFEMDLKDSTNRTFLTFVSIGLMIIGFTLVLVR